MPMSPDAPAEDIDPALAHVIEEAILFGKQPQLEALLEQLDLESVLPDGLRHDLESLVYFRAHYRDDSTLNAAARQQFVRADAEWTMQLIQRLHPRTFQTRFG